MKRQVNELERKPRDQTEREGWRGLPASTIPCEQLAPPFCSGRREGGDNISIRSSNGGLHCLQTLAPASHRIFLLSSPTASTVAILSTPRCQVYAPFDPSTPSIFGPMFVSDDCPKNDYAWEVGCILIYSE
jgi:hypothetical protein